MWHLNCVYDRQQKHFIKSHTDRAVLGKQHETKDDDDDRVARESCCCCCLPPRRRRRFRFPTWWDRSSRRWDKDCYRDDGIVPSSPLYFLGDDSACHLPFWHSLFTYSSLSLSFFSYTLSTFTFYLCARAPALNWRMIEWFIPVREFCHFPRLLLLLPQSSFAWGHLAGYTPRYMCDVIATCYYQPFPPVGFNRCITQTQRKILTSLKASA